MPATWLLALRSLESARVPSDVNLTEIPAPARLAPYAAAFAADVIPHAHGDDSALGTGRFVLLHDPEGNDAWQGTMRVVCFAKAPLEADLGLDPFLADVAWSWLLDALTDNLAHYEHASGTATKTINVGFGELATRTEGTEMEIRASWSPEGPSVGAHLVAWASFLRQLSGIPPLPEGVASLDLLHHPRNQGPRVD